MLDKRYTCFIGRLNHLSNYLRVLIFVVLKRVENIFKSNCFFRCLMFAFCLAFCCFVRKRYQFISQASNMFRTHSDRYGRAVYYNAVAERWTQY